MNIKPVGLKLGMAFAVLIAILVGVGQLGIRRMRVFNETLNDITGKQSAKLELAQRALMISNTNSRIAMEIVADYTRCGWCSRDRGMDNVAYNPRDSCAI